MPASASPMRRTTSSGPPRRPRSDRWTTGLIAGPGTGKTTTVASQPCSRSRQRSPEIAGPGKRFVEPDSVAHAAAEPTVLKGRTRSLLRVVAAGAVIGILGGLIGLGGAEFRLPLLIRVFGFVALQDVILNKALSLVVVITALPARLLGVPYSDVSDH